MQIRSAFEPNKKKINGSEVIFDKNEPIFSYGDAENDKVSIDHDEIEKLSKKSDQKTATISREMGPVIKAGDFVFPYSYSFAGQDRNERILFVVREAKVMLHFRLIGVLGLGILVMLILWGLGNWISGMVLDVASVWLVIITLMIVNLLAITAICYWLLIIWQKTIGLVTNYRLLKLVQTNPFNSVTQTLPLKEVVDTSSDTRGILSYIFKISTFTARSSATSSGVATSTSTGQGEKNRINRKYFYFENITNSADLENYLNKLLHALDEHSAEEMRSFRPFIPQMKGEVRARFMEDYPEFWS